MAKQGHRVMSIAPRYDQYYDAWDTEFTAEVPMGDVMTTVRFFHAFKKGVDRVFVDHPLFLEKVWGQTKQKLYGPKWGKDYEDNQLRFAMFCKAALIATQKLSLGGYSYGENVVFVANDWHAALLPMYLKVARAKGEGWQNAKCSMLLHNLAFQGRFPSDPKAAERLHLPKDIVESMRIVQPLKVGKQKKQTKGLKSREEVPNPAIECLNFIMGGIKACDSILTVSPGYAKEVAASPEKGCELEDIIKVRCEPSTASSSSQCSLLPYFVDPGAPTWCLIGCVECAAGEGHYRHPQRRGGHREARQRRAWSRGALQRHLAREEARGQGHDAGGSGALAPPPTRLVLFVD
jgi:granule-bound starch synthase